VTADPRLRPQSHQGVIKVQIHNYELTSHIYSISEIIDRSDVDEVFGFSSAADAVQ